MTRWLVVLVALTPAVSWAAVWKRERTDGVLEFTNLPQAGKSWRKSPSFPAPGPSPSSLNADALPAPSSSGASPGASAAESATIVSAEPRHGDAAIGAGSGAFWFRERSDGIVEFTNLPPIGARWKVLFRTGPGKASALRGSTDRVPARDTSPDRFSRYEAHIRDQQAFYGIPPALVRAVIKTESDFDPHVVSSAGALGLMQLLPETARAMGVTDVFDPRQNVMGGSRYLQTLARRFCQTPARGDEGVMGGFVCSPDEEVKVLAGYHAGPGAVDKYGGLPPYETTRAYVTMVLARYDQFRRREAESAGLQMGVNP